MHTMLRAHSMQSVTREQGATAGRSALPLWTGASAITGGGTLDMYSLGEYDI